MRYFLIAYQPQREILHTPIPMIQFEIPTFMLPGDSHLYPLIPGAYHGYGNSAIV